jgi:hypothetical protein
MNHFELFLLIVGVIAGYYAAWHRYLVRNQERFNLDKFETWAFAVFALPATAIVGLILGLIWTVTR